jgi:hypothetical protein
MPLNTVLDLYVEVLRYLYNEEKHFPQSLSGSSIDASEQQLKEVFREESVLHPGRLTTLYDIFKNFENAHHLSLLNEHENATSGELDLHKSFFANRSSRQHETHQLDILETRS